MFWLNSGHTNQTEARPLTDTETKTLLSQPPAIHLALKWIDQITQTINWKRFTANWQYFTSFNSRHWPFLPETLGYKDCHEVCQEDTSHIVYRWPRNSFCQDGNIPFDELDYWRNRNQLELFFERHATKYTNFYFKL